MEVVKPPDISNSGEWLSDVYARLEPETDEIEAIRSLQNHDGWKALMRKVWPRYEIYLLIQGKSQKDPLKKAELSGQYDGFKFCQRISQAIVDPRSKPEPVKGQRQKTSKLQGLFGSDRR